MIIMTIFSSRSAKRKWKNKRRNRDIPANSDVIYLKHHCLAYIIETTALSENVSFRILFPKNYTIFMDALYRESFLLHRKFPTNYPHWLSWSPSMCSDTAKRHLRKVEMERKVLLQTKKWFLTTTSFQIVT